VPALTVRKLEVMHRATTAKGDEPRGALGLDSFATRRLDTVTVQGELSEPAYCYLIAFRPDGTEEVCFPEDANTPPPLTAQPAYPSVTVGVSYELNEGEGLMVFALVGGRRPQPAYAAWRRQWAPCPWRKTAAQRDVVWSYDGRQLLPFTPDDTRGPGRALKGADPLKKLIDWLRATPDVEVVSVVAFPVLPAAKK
jgi:hypothetical protein